MHQSISVILFKIVVNFLVDTFQFIYFTAKLFLSVMPLTIIFAFREYSKPYKDPACIKGEHEEIVLWGNDALF